MSKRIDGLVPRGVHKEPKGPTKNKPRETFGKRPISPEEEQHICETYNVSVVDNTFVAGPPQNDKERLLQQVSYWIANDNLVQVRTIMKSLGFPSRMIKAYINDEQDLQKEQPEISGYSKFKNNPMPEEFRVRGN